MTSFDVAFEIVPVCTIGKDGISASSCYESTILVQLDVEYELVRNSEVSLLKMVRQRYKNLQLVTAATSTPLTTC